MTKITIKNADDSIYMEEKFSDQPSAIRWLENQKTKPSWDSARKIQIKDITTVLEMNQGDNQGEPMATSEEIRQEMIDTVQTKTSDMIAAAKAEVVVTPPVDVPPGGEVPPAEEMIPKSVALQMVKDEGDKRFSEGVGTGTENENKRVMPLVQAAIDSDRATDEELVAKLGLAPKA